MKRYLYVLVAILALLSLYLYSSVYKDRSVIVSYDSALSIGDNTFNTKLADDNEERRQGLSDTASLCDRCAMLFVFDREGIYPFWMKDMHYDLDILYLDSEKRVVDIFENVKKESYPERVTNKNMAKYVLEINAGLSSELNIKLGDVAKF